MAALLLRQGARRIGGSSPLQRAQAAFTAPAAGEERRRLVARRMLSTGQRAPEEITRDIQRKEQELAAAIAEGKRSLKAATNFRDIHYRPSAQQAQQKKEELYEALSKVENWRNRRLLMDLAVHVYPKRPNTQWHRLRASKWATNVVRAVATVSFATGASMVLHVLKTMVKSYVAEKRKIAEDYLEEKRKIAEALMPEK